MGTPRAPQPVKLFAGLLANSAELFPPVEDELAALWGPIDSASEIVPWTLTDYYEKEMGPGLLRRFVSFAPLVSPEGLAGLKLKAMGVEGRYRRGEGADSGRRVNIDPGYLDAGKLVLASTKAAPHRIYLSSGIHAEITLLFEKGSFHPLSYTYPDYLWPESLAFFLELRSLFLDQLKKGAK